MASILGRGRRQLKSRLPTIQNVGKYMPVDEDEPPDVPIQAFGFEDGDQSMSSAFETTFDSADAEDATKFLRKAFTILEPGCHAYKRMPEMDGGYFSHCPRGVPIAREYSSLRRLMQERTQLELIRDCLSRIKSVQTFVGELDCLIQMECRTVYSIRHSCATETPVTKLYCLNALCEDLRLHVSHWNSIKQRVNTNRWLQPHLGLLLSQLHSVMHALTSVVHQAVRNLDLLIHIGFEVFAHCNVEALTPEIMWNITRGLEDFNNIVNGLKLTAQNQNIPSKDSFQPSNSTPSTTYNSTPHPPSLSTSPPWRTLQLIPFAKVLNILSNERSKYAAKLTHQFFTSNEHFKRLSNTGDSTLFEWGDYLPHQNQPHTQFVVGADIPDFHNTSTTGSNTSLNATYLRVGSIRAPDLSNYISPLVEFSRKEQEFAESFLLIVCNSTSLLRKNDPPKQHRSNRAGNSTNTTDLKPPMSPVVGRALKTQFPSEGLVMTRNDSARRKTVSWGDNADNSIRSQVVAHYMDSLWMHFGHNLDLFLDEPAWCKDTGLLSSEMGSVLMLTDTIVTILRNMIEHVCHKDLFPPTSVQPLLGVVFRLHVLSAFAAWDASLSSSLASESVDKCTPCQLSDDSYSTQTGKRLKESFNPLISVLCEILHSLADGTGGDDSVARPDIDLSLCAGVAQRVVTTSKMAVSWCGSKGQQFLSSWSVNPFLLMVHTDLKLLTDCTKHASYLIQSLRLNEERSMPLVSDNLAVSQIVTLSQHTSDVTQNIQSLSGSHMKLFVEKYTQVTHGFFQENFPPARVWKKKGPFDESNGASPYAVSLTNGLLSPIINGISVLSTTSQIGLVSTVTLALCNTWMNFILKEKIRFSYWGAIQLSLDFDHVTKQLKKVISSPEVVQSVIELTVFKQMKGVIFLLLRQPLQKQAGKFSMDNFFCDSASTISHKDSSPVVLDSLGTASTSTMATPIHHGNLGNGTHKSTSSSAATGTVTVSSHLPHHLQREDEEAIAAVPNVQEWLALRVIGGTKQWKFSGCFSKTTGVD